MLAAAVEVLFQVLPGGVGEQDGDQDRLLLCQFTSVSGVGVNAFDNGGYPFLDRTHDHFVHRRGQLVALGAETGEQVGLGIETGVIGAGEMAPGLVGGNVDLRGESLWHKEAHQLPQDVGGQGAADIQPQRQFCRDRALAGPGTAANQ